MINKWVCSLSWSQSIQIDVINVWNWFFQYSINIFICFTFMFHRDFENPLDYSVCNLFMYLLFKFESYKIWYKSILSSMAFQLLIKQLRNIFIGLFWFRRKSVIISAKFYSLKRFFIEWFLSLALLWSAIGMSE